MNTNFTFNKNKKIVDNPPFMRLTFKNTQERVAQSEYDNQLIDVTPVDLDKKAFKLRKRSPEKEIGPSQMHMKSFRTIDKLNSLYEDDLKVLDCEIFQKKPKKRVVMA